MNRPPLSIPRPHSLVLFLGAIAAVLLWWKLELGIVRYFDADEFAYLHWAHNVFTGSVPYRDFLLYVPPGFLYFLAPLFFVFPDVSALVAGRVMGWVIFVGIAILLGCIAVILGKSRPKHDPSISFLLPVILLASLPMPADKFLEIRPDSLALLISLAALLLQLRARAFWAGVFYGVSLIILPKSMPQVVVALLVFPSVALVTGIAIPILFCIGVFMIISGLPAVSYSLLTLPFEVNRIGELFGMRPDLFFYPNTTYYGISGWNAIIVTNHILWFTGIAMGLMRLLTPFLGAGRRDLLVAGSFFAYIAAFMYGYPLRHAQYLIPVAAFVSLYAADFLSVICLRPGTRYIQTALVGFVVLYVTGMTGTAQMQKLRWTNNEDIQTLTTVRTLVPTDAYVFDLVGSTIYFRDPYYVSAVPFGQWERYLTRPLPDLAEALERTDTRYVFQGKLRRVDTLTPEDRAYVRRHFAPSKELGDDLLVRIR